MTLQTLSSFLSGYLHQDWNLEYSDSEEAAEVFGRSENEDIVIRVLGELAMLLSANWGEDQLDRYLVEAGCYYRPTESTRRAWLEVLVDRIAAEASKRWL